ncbi:MAG: hypothetical protein MUP80_03740, partial [Acidobacteriia bacterium]|nr:hypothetical protein [Terriglobia bacterium]
MPNIIYFVGAGLTKSLQRSDFPVPLMNDFVSVMADYIDDDVILTALAELEKMELYKWRDPKATQLGSSLITRDTDRSDSRRREFQQVVQNRPAESIEKLLAEADRLQRNSPPREPRLPLLRFVYGINRLFCRVEWNVNFDPLTHFLTTQLSLPNSRHTFISFNYDLVLDRGIQSISSGAWDVRKDYGFRIDFYSTHRPNNAIVDKEYFDAKRFDETGTSETRILILKPNGSLNWLVPLDNPYDHAKQGFAFQKTNA